MTPTPPRSEQMNALAAEPGVALCVDCDGTLTPTDLLHESALLLLKQAPSQAWKLPFWLCKGKAHLKARLAACVSFSWKTIPLNPAVLEHIRQARLNGCRVVLTTASHATLARPFAASVELFDEVLCTNDTTNLSGHTKANELIRRFGSGGFDYIGNSSTDLPVWASSRRALVVSASEQLHKAVSKVSSSVQIIESPTPSAASYVKAVRLHQWLKNLLVFVPLLGSHQITSMVKLGAALQAFLAFGLCASAVYLINDLLDLESDRQHARKRDRPFASGLIPLSQGMILAPLMLLGGAVVSAFLPPTFALVLACYFICTLAYSLRLKRQVVVDVMLLAALYTSRILAGGAAVSVIPSFWLLSLSMFLFLSLALVKRYSELRLTLQKEGKMAAGRGYTVDDLPVLLALGISSGMAAVLVFCLYIHDPSTTAMYPSPQRLWGIPALILYWVSRIWIKVHRGEVDDDPVLFAAKDWQSVVLVAIGALIFVAGASA